MGSSDYTFVALVALPTWKRERLQKNIMKDPRSRVYSFRHRTYLVRSECWCHTLYNCCHQGGRGRGGGAGGGRRWTWVSVHCVQVLLAVFQSSMAFIYHSGIVMDSSCRWSVSLIIKVLERLVWYRSRQQRQAYRPTIAGFRTLAIKEVEELVMGKPVLRLRN